MPTLPKKGLWENRNAPYHMYDAPGVPKCSIVVIGYNRLKKTKYCVECVLKFTQDIDYELILVDNGSDDGTFDFYQSVSHEKKKIIKITSNLGLMYATIVARQHFTGKYLVIIPNDVYVTANWLSNLLTCYESDPKIGFVVPSSSNTSNLQQVDILYGNFDEMQKKACEFNKSDPLKWEQRLRILNVISIFSRPILDIVGLTDSAFPHDFGDDDIALRIRRSGYKLMFCGDTWVCHDHEMSTRDPALLYQRIEAGRAIFREKYNEIDPWDDFNNYELTMSNIIKSTELLSSNQPRVLTIDGRCGTPLLDIYNALWQKKIVQVDGYAFTTNAKYYLDLQTVAIDVKCGYIDSIQSYYADAFFDIIALCTPLNLYPTPITLLQRLYNFLKPNGILLFKLRNTDNYNTLLRVTGLGGSHENEMSCILTLKSVTECLKVFGGESISLMSEGENLQLEDINYIQKRLSSINPKASQHELSTLLTRNYICSVVKPENSIGFERCSCKCNRV